MITYYVIDLDGGAYAGPLATFEAAARALSTARALHPFILFSIVEG